MRIIKEIVKPDIHLTVWRNGDGTVRCVATNILFKKQYRHQKQLVNNRIIKLNNMHSKCEQCKKSGNIIHHIDRISSNHNIHNLKLLCRSCHTKLHKSLIS